MNSIGLWFFAAWQPNSSRWLVNGVTVEVDSAGSTGGPFPQTPLDFPNSLGDQQHGSLQPFLSSGVPINAYDLPGAYRKPVRRVGPCLDPTFALSITNKFTQRVSRS